MHYLFCGHLLNIKWISTLCQFGSSEMVASFTDSRVGRSNVNCVLQSRVKSCPFLRPTSPFVRRENYRVVTANVWTRSSFVTASPTARTSPTRTPAVSNVITFACCDRATCIYLSARQFQINNCRCIFAQNIISK